MLAGTKWLIGAALATPVAFAALSTAPVAADLGGDPPVVPTESAPTAPTDPVPTAPTDPVPPTATDPLPPVTDPVPSPTDPTMSPKLAMESQLAALGLPTGTVDGVMTARTKRGLCVFRDLTGMRATRKPPSASLLDRITATTELPRLPRALRDVKALVSLTCQAAYITDGSRKVLRVLPVSTGKDNGLYRTRPGFKRVYYKVNRWQRSTLFPEPDGRPGLYRPIYFDRGIAFHGVRKPIRTYPQSHACVRTWPSDQDWLWSRLQVRDKVFVYGDYWRGRSPSLGGYGRPA